MITQPELHPCIEAPNFGGETVFPWHLAERDRISFIPISGELNDLEIGLIIALLLQYNHIEFTTGVEGALTAIINNDWLVLPGGLQAVDGYKVINPGCCCGLETWREWYDCLESRKSPWMGHDPAPWIEWIGDVAKVWSDGAITNAPDKVAIEFDRSRFISELDQVQDELNGFLGRIGEWASSLGFSNPTALCVTIDTIFRITGTREPS